MRITGKNSLMLLIYFVLSILFFLFVGCIQLQLLSFFAFSLVFFALGSIYMKRINQKRMMRLIFKIEEIAAGNLSGKIEVNSKDEIGQLANALNELISKLQSEIALDVSRHKEIQEAKTSFVSIASHQLRTPLSIVKWYTDYIKGGDAGPLTNEQIQYLSEIYNSNERAITLVSALLDVSRIDMGTFAISPHPSDVISLAEEVLQEFNDKAKFKEIKIEKIFEELPPIDLDQKLMKKVFRNLISNAIKYTEQKGLVRMTIKKTETDCLIEISDTGCGIPKEEHPKVFTKLFRATNAKKMDAGGTGLGLYIIKAIIENSGGKIWFESPSLDLFLEQEKKNPKKAEGRGTSFFVTIPLSGMRRRAGKKQIS